MRYGPGDHTATGVPTGGAVCAPPVTMGVNITDMVEPAPTSLTRFDSLYFMQFHRTGQVADR